MGMKRDIKKLTQLAGSVDMGDMLEEIGDITELIQTFQELHVGWQIVETEINILKLQFSVVGHICGWKASMTQKQQEQYAQLLQELTRLITKKESLGDSE